MGHTDAFVVDSSAALAVIFDEPGADAVEPHLARGLITSTNLAETVDTCWRVARTPSSFVLSHVRSLGIELVDFTINSARHVSTLRRVEQRRSSIRRSRERLSMADVCCLAFATEHRLPVLTADRYWADLTHFGLEPEVVLIR